MFFAELFKILLTLMLATNFLEMGCFTVNFVYDSHAIMEQLFQNVYCTFQGSFCITQLGPALKKSVGADSQ